MILNRSPAELYHAALRDAAEAQNRATVADKKAKRIWSQCYLMAKGAVEERKALASTNPAYTAAEDAWLEAATAANIAKAEAEGVGAEFEWHRSMEATKRQEMNLR